MSATKHIAIIPAKKESLRLPCKNTKEFLGEPLFMHSVRYALAEGVMPVVSTDSSYIINICLKHGIEFVEETVDDSNMANCVAQVLEEVPCDGFTLLQPTSPLRMPGVLKMADAYITDTRTDDKPTVYTAQDIKPIGELDGKFRIAYRDQDTPSRFFWFDGNMLTSTTRSFRDTGSLFGNNPKPWVNKFPCTLQIDTPAEWSVLEAVAKLPNFREYVHAGVIVKE